MSKRNYFFKWTGITSTGEKKSDVLFVASKKEGIAILSKNHILILSLKKYQPIFHNSFSIKQKLAFSEHLFLLLQSGLSLVEVFTLMHNTSRKTHESFLFLAIKHQLSSGKQLHETLAQFPSYFDDYYCAMIAAAEKNGDLLSVLKMLIHHQKQLSTTTQKIQKAFFYPVIILLTAFFVCLGLLMFVIPQFSQIYSSFNATLPLITQDMITASHAISHHFFIFILAMLLAAGALPQLKKMAPYLFKNTFVIQQIAHWSQMLHITLSAHISLLEGLHMANKLITHPQLKKELILATFQITQGKKLHDTLSECRFFPDEARYFIAIGENGDALDHLIERIAHLYTQRWHDRLDYLSKMIEPVMMIFVAGLVSCLIFAMYLPIFKMGTIL